MTKLINNMNDTLMTHDLAVSAELHDARFVYLASVLYNNVKFYHCTNQDCFRKLMILSNEQISNLKCKSIPSIS